MSIAYLAAWQGPVYEEDDPYGDEETNPELEAVMHLEEALIINERNFDVLKSAIFRYGAIETIYIFVVTICSQSVYCVKNAAMLTQRLCPVVSSIIRIYTRCSVIKITFAASVYQCAVRPHNTTV